MTNQLITHRLLTHWLPIDVIDHRLVMPGNEHGVFFNLSSVNWALTHK